MSVYNTIDRSGFHDDFHGNLAPPAVGSSDASPWCSLASGAEGSPTVLSSASSSSGEIIITLDSEEEAEVACLYWGDHLAIDIDMIQFAEWVVRAEEELDEATSIAFGLASARNDAIDLIAHAALFRAIGSNAVLVETDDGVRDIDDIATPAVLTETPQRFVIDFSLGKSHVRFFATNEYGQLERVAANQTFDMSGYSGSLQPFFQIQKGVSDNTDWAAADYFRFEQKRR